MNSKVNTKYYNNKYFDDRYNHEEYYPLMKEIAKCLKSICFPTYVLDVGCAMGYLVKAFQDLGVKSIGVDVSEYALKNAIVDEVFLMDAEKLGFKRNSFDLITAMDVVEHLEKPKKFASEAYRILKPSGYLFVVTPKPNTLDAKKDPTHISIFPEKEWLKIFSDFDRIKRKEKLIARSISLYYSNIYIRRSPSSLSGKILNIFRLRKFGIYLSILIQQIRNRYFFLFQKRL